MYGFKANTRTKVVCLQGFEKAPCKGTQPRRSNIEQAEEGEERVEEVWRVISLILKPGIFRTK